jgi:predicted aspartyl protease
MIDDSIYFHEFQKKEGGKCCYLWAGIKGKTMQGLLMLVDTGASISILPLEIYEELRSSQKSKIKPTSMTICTGNSGKVDVRGTADITIDLEGVRYTHEFYICGDCRCPIIGFDFQQKYDLYLRPGENALYMQNKKLPCFDHSTFWGKTKVTMYQQYTIAPNHEAIISGQVL